MHALIEQRIAEDILVRFRSPEVCAEREAGDERPQNESRDQCGSEQTRKDAQCPLREIMQRVRGLLEALRHEKSADREEHEHAGQAQYRLVAGQQD